MRPPSGSLRRLVRCVKALGLRLGWKYWRIQNKANVNPWIALQWAENCERMADELRNVNPELAAAHRSALKTISELEAKLAAAQAEVAALTKE